MPKHRVLIVEDERDIAGLIKHTLERAGDAEAEIVESGDAALRAVSARPPDLIILDLNLPVLSGSEVCRILRGRSDGRHLPIIMLTARTAENDRVAGLELGADDYVTKPFSPRELVARVHAMLRRPRGVPTGGSQAEALRFGSLRVDVGAREVRSDGSLVDLTRTEFDVLATLAGRPRLVFTRRQLIDAIWGESWVGDEHLVDVHIGHLRRKLGDDPDAGRFVRTVRGVGYRMGEGR
jgi:DNA-binding response OmpR family regulator